MHRVHVWMSKEEIDESVLTEATVVVMDVLLATTTLVTMLENGARRVFPVADQAEARFIQRFLSPGALTGGEHHGQPIPDFDCGPLPEEYSPSLVSNRDVILMTTNGTKAIRKTESAAQLLVANLRNAPAVAEYLEKRAASDVYLVCAGSRGHTSLEDAMCAGVILSYMNPDKVTLNDAGRVVRDGLVKHMDNVFDWITQGRVGRWFMQNGQEDTLRFVADVGASRTLAEVKDRQLQLLYLS